MFRNYLANAWRSARRDRFYAQFGLQKGGLHRPRAEALKKQLKLGIPMGASIMIEVTGFTFMAICIARLGPIHDDNRDAPLAP